MARKVHLQLREEVCRCAVSSFQYILFFVPPLLFSPSPPIPPYPLLPSFYRRQVLPGNIHEGCPTTHDKWINHLCLLQCPLLERHSSPTRYITLLSPLFPLFLSIFSPSPSLSLSPCSFALRYYADVVESYGQRALIGKVCMDQLSPHDCILPLLFISFLFFLVLFLPFFFLSSINFNLIIFYEEQIYKQWRRTFKKQKNS